MIHTASLIHKGVVNISEQFNLEQQQLTASNCDKNSQMADLEFGNKMAILSGDFLLANASKGLASLNNTKVMSI
jgi:decaprenyl-diphosphate synthase subunit 2